MCSTLQLYSVFNFENCAVLLYFLHYTGYDEESHSSRNVFKKKRTVGTAGVGYVVKLHQFSARETGQKSPRAFKGLNETFKEEGFYEREILQQTVCTHLTDQYTSEDVARTKLPCYIPVYLFIPVARKTFAAITQLKLEATLLSILS